MVCDLSVVITASFIPSHPDIKHIRGVIESLSMLNLDNDICIILSHDKIKEGTNPAYDAYFNNINLYVQTCKFTNIKTIITPQWGGLLGSVRNAMNYVETKYVMIIQHDLPFIYNIDIHSIISIIEHSPNIKHLRFNLRHNLPFYWDGGWNDPINREYCERSFKEIEVNGHRLCKTLAWSDNNHLTTKRYYEEVVFPDCDGVHFMEHSLNDKNKITPERYGTYIYGGYNHPPVIHHTDGRKKAF